MQSIKCPHITGSVPHVMTINARLNSWAKPKFAKGPRNTKSLRMRVRRVAYPRMRRIGVAWPMMPSKWAITKIVPMW